MCLMESTVASWLAVAALSEAADRETAWGNGYEPAHAEIFNIYYEGWGLQTKRGDSAAMAPAMMDVIREREHRATEVLTAVQADLTDRGLLTTPAPVVIMVGVGSSNGWTTTYQGEPTLFLALEVFPDPPFDQVLIAHELIHLAQARHAGDHPDRVDCNIFAEGLAVVGSRYVCPGLSPSAYLWFDENHHDWIRECAESRPQLLTMVAEHLETTDSPNDVRVIFSFDPQHRLPDRFGYWLGAKLIDDLQHSGDSLADLVALPQPRVTDIVRTWINDQSQHSH